MNFNIFVTDFDNFFLSLMIKLENINLLIINTKRRMFNGKEKLFA